jgi:hypothetical protein
VISKSFIIAETLEIRVERKLSPTRIATSTKHYITTPKPHHPHTTAIMVKLEEVEDEHFNTQQTGEDAWISDSDSGKKAISCAASSYIKS